MALTRCPCCEALNRVDARFCGNCGNQLVDFEQAQDLRSGLRLNFCDCCGSRLQPSWTAEPVDPGSEGTSANLVLETERKQLTVLFADIVASTSLIAGRDPEEARALLDPLLRSMIEATPQPHGGSSSRPRVIWTTALPPSPGC